MIKNNVKILGNILNRYLKFNKEMVNKLKFSKFWKLILSFFVRKRIIGKFQFIYFSLLNYKHLFTLIFMFLVEYSLFRSPPTWWPSCARPWQRWRTWRSRVGCGGKRPQRRYAWCGGRTTLGRTSGEENIFFSSLLHCSGLISSWHQPHLPLSCCYESEGIQYSCTGCWSSRVIRNLVKS